jgi:hypothetical protein
MKAIQVRYIQSTKTLGSRWKAWVQGGASVIVPYDYSMNAEDNARMAADALMNKLCWGFDISGTGSLPNGDYVFTLSA